jgi:predicted hydrocarbon binding protein/KaiC/GvpD/RAD55 family RecA-like ATPase
MKTMSLTALHEIPSRTYLLLTGAPGTGKSSFGQQAMLKWITKEMPVIYVTTERSLPDLLDQLQERGLGDSLPPTVGFVDAFSETVGLASEKRPNTVTAHCADLNSLSIAVTKLKQRMGTHETLLLVDSLTSPYLFIGAEVIRFTQLFLSKFAAEGNTVLALIDEGCGKEQDLVAMQSVADSILRMEVQNGSRMIQVLKHPRVEAGKIEIPIEIIPSAARAFEHNPQATKRLAKSMHNGGEPYRAEVGDFLSPFWPNLAHWSGMLWDPRGFPRLIYDLNWEDGSSVMESTPYMPLRLRLMINSVFFLQSIGIGVPKRFESVDQIKQLTQRGIPWILGAHTERSGIIEYLEGVSSSEEHIFRIQENSDCWGFEGIGTPIASHLPPCMAGMLSGFERIGKDWHAFETKCIGLGDPYCEVKVVRGDPEDLKAAYEKDSDTVERIHNHLMDRLMGFLLREEPLFPDRPKLGNEVHMHVAFHAMGFPHLGGDRYRMAIRMGGAKSGHEIGNRLMEAGIQGDEALQRVLDFMNHCKVGKVTLNPRGDRLSIKENVESIRTHLFMAYDEPSCDFTTGFLSGVFSSLKDQRVREIKCIAAGDTLCQWEIY